MVQKTRNHNGTVKLRLGHNRKNSQKDVPLVKKIAGTIMNRENHGKGEQKHNQQKAVRV